MEHLNLIIQRGDEGLQLYEGAPHDFEVEDRAAVYISFIYKRVHVTCWTLDTLDVDERREISRQLLLVAKDRAR